MTLSGSRRAQNLRDVIPSLFQDQAAGDEIMGEQIIRAQKPAVRAGHLVTWAFFAPSRIMNR